MEDETTPTGPSADHDDRVDPPRRERWDLDFDSDVRRPLIRHGYWPVLIGWTRREFRARYRQSGLRSGWALWQPLSIVAINGLFFHSVLNVTGGGLPYLVFIVAGIMAYRFLSTGLSSANVITENASVITKAYFPRELIPLSAIIVAFIDLGVMLGALLVLAELQGVGLGLTLLALPFVLLVLIASTTWITLLLSAFTVFVRDVAYLLPTINQLLFLGSPIMYPASRVPGSLKWMNHVNPLAVCAEGVRDVVLRHHWPHWGVLSIHLAVAIMLCFAALWYTRAIEVRMVDVA